MKSILDGQHLSMIEYLREKYPHLSLNLDNLAKDNLNVLKGTTIIAIKFKDGVVMASDGQATAGYYKVFNDFEKLKQIEKRTIIAIAGNPAISIAICDSMKAEIKKWNRVYSTKLSTEGKVNRLSRILLNNMSLTAAGIVMMPIFATFEIETKKPRIFHFSSDGSYKEQDYCAEGSGGPTAATVIAEHYSKNLNSEKAIEISIRALRAAHNVDAATGENLFVKLIDKDGVLEFTRPDRINKLLSAFNFNNKEEK
jgi:proteasome beta subunit